VGDQPDRQWRNDYICHGTPAANALLCSSEGVEPGDRASNDQGLNGVGALVGVNGFDVGVVPRDVVIEQDSVAAQDIPSHRADPAGSVTGVQLGQITGDVYGHTSDDTARAAVDGVAGRLGL
jgi:hypothetical protein